MKQFFKMMFASMLGFFLIFIVFGFLIFGIMMAAISLGKDKEVSISENTILTINFSEEIKDRSNKNPFSGFDFGSFTPKKSLGLNDIVENLKNAKTDKNIKGIFLDLETIKTGIATLEEIRNALLDFKTSGKFIYCYSSNYTQSSYYLASVSDKIFLNPQGGLDFKGLKAEVMFFKGALEKLEIQPEIIRHGKFKSAVEPFMLDKMSDANREQTKTYVFSLWNHFLDGISKQRKISVDELTQIADNFKIQRAEDAVTNKLADKLVYRDEMLDILREKVGMKKDDKLKFITLNKYERVPKSKDAKGKLEKDKIAVIYATGQIVDGESKDDNIGGESLSKTIREARLDDKVKAVVLRVNSPGGSALASEIIWREVFLTRKVKPVVVSMGDVAASGGYYISCAADKIYAQPNTITGSIGVFGLMWNGKKLLNNKLGITTDIVKTNKYADLGDQFRPMLQDERDIIQKSVEDIYDVFTTRVADGRKMQKASVDSIGQGRVWSGTDAKRIGLVDEFGGLDKAIEGAAKLAKLDKYSIKEMPKTEEAFKQILKMLNDDEDVSASILARELGVSYKYYKNLKDLVQMDGIQARIPFVIEVH